MSSEEILKKIAKWPTGNIADALWAMGYMGVVHADIRPIYLPIKLAGRARTVEYARSNRPGDGVSGVESKAAAKPGDVYVLAMGGYMHGDRTVWGENSATAIKKGGAVGTIIDGACRDTAALRKMKFPLFCRAYSPGGGTNTFYPVAFDIPVEFGGIRVKPGDIVVGDDDGICIIPQEIEQEAVKWITAYGERDSAVAPAMNAGKSVAEAYAIKKDWVKKAGLK